MSQASAHPEISILVPIYNVERYLRECLDSILAQSFQDYEVICINDGSTDSSPQIVQEYLDADARFRMIDKPNSGYGASMNRGLDEARGTYVAILESDDVYSDDALQVLHDAAVEHDAQVVKGDFDLYWSMPEPKSERFGIVDELPLGRVVDPREEHEVFYRKPSIWSAMYLRAFLDDNRIRFLETPGASYQDAGFNFKVWSCARRVVFLDQVILKYRQDNETSSVNSPSKIYCVCDEYAEMQAWVDADPEQRGRFQGVLERMRYDSYLWNYDRLNDEFKEDFIMRASREMGASKTAGRIDLSLFEPWAEANLNCIISEPESFAKYRYEIVDMGKFGTFKHYFRQGGLPLVLKVMRYKRAEKDGSADA